DDRVTTAVSQLGVDMREHRVDHREHDRLHVLVELTATRAERVQFLGLLAISKTFPCNPEEFSAESSQEEHRECLVITRELSPSDECRLDEVDDESRLVLFDAGSSAAV